MITKAEIDNAKRARKSFKFSIIQSSSYLHFVEQCQLNNKHAGSDEALGSYKKCYGHTWPSQDAHSDKLLSEVYSWRPTAKLFYYAATTYYAFVVSKYIILHLIAPGSLLEAYQRLDCFIPSRCRFIGRTSVICNQITSFMSFSMCVLKVSMVAFTSGFKFYAGEFMLNNYEDVASAKSVIRLNVATKRQKSLSLSAGKTTRADSVFYLRNPFSRHRDEWILRLNRTPKCWLRLCRYTSAATYGMLLMYAAWFSMALYLVGGSLITNLGFEMSYPTCTRWLKHLQMNGSNEYSYIYVAPEVLASDKRIDELPARIPISLADFKEMSPYRIILMLADLVENLISYTEIISLIGAIAYLLLINSIDIVTNASLIRERLAKLLDQLDSHEEPSPHSGVISSHLSLVRGGLLEELERTQAIILDHFETTRACNRFTSIFFLYLFGVWIGYTAIICTWVGKVRSRSVEFEFLIAQSLSAAFVVSLLSIAAIVRAYNIQLYSLIVRIMSKKSNSITTRLRWASLMNFFYPRPYFCLALFDYAEISWLFNLKVR
jgi:hypothetical protein